MNYGPPFNCSSEKETGMRQFNDCVEEIQSNTTNTVSDAIFTFGEMRAEHAGPFNASIDESIKKSESELHKTNRDRYVYTKQ